MVLSDQLIPVKGQTEDMSVCPTFQHETAV